MLSDYEKRYPEEVHNHYLNRKLSIKEESIFETLLDLLECSYSEYGATYELKDIVLNGFPGINNMSEKEARDVIKKMRYNILDRDKKHWIERGYEDQGEFEPSKRWKIDQYEKEDL